MFDAARLHCSCRHSTDARLSKVPKNFVSFSKVLSEFFFNEVTTFLKFLEPGNVREFYKGQGKGIKSWKDQGICVVGNI